MRVYLGSDHAGFELKAHLLAHLASLGHEAIDVGAAHYDADDDYPAFCIEAASRVLADPGSLGIVIGGSGNGEQIAANKVPGVRAGAGLERRDGHPGPSAQRRAGGGHRRPDAAIARRTRSSTTASGSRLYSAMSQSRGRPARRTRAATPSGPTCRSTKGISAFVTRQLTSAGMASLWSLNVQRVPLLARLEDQVERRLGGAAEAREAGLGEDLRAGAPRRPVRRGRARPPARASSACRSWSTRRRRGGRPALSSRSRLSSAKGSTSSTVPSALRASSACGPRPPGRPCRGDSRRSRPDRSSAPR